MSYFNPGSVLVGLVIPFVAVVGGVAILSRSQALVQLGRSIPSVGSLADVPYTPV